MQLADISRAVPCTPGLRIAGSTILALVFPLVCAAEPWRGIPMGREHLLGPMLGQGQTLPGGCTFAGGSNGAFVTARYACASGGVRLQLRNGEDAPPSAIRTDHFGIVLEDGSPPPGFLDAISSMVRAREAEVLFDSHAGLSPDARTTLGGAAAIALIAVIIQCVLPRRWICGANAEARLPPRSILALTLTAAVVATYVVSRVVFLRSLPAFNDEATHILWAQSGFGAYLASELSVGKWLPLQIMAIFLWLPMEPLMAVRLASIVMGLATLLGCLAISRELSSGSAGIVAGAMYVALPIALFYDRLALADVYVSAFATGAVWCALRLRRSPATGSGIGLSICLCAAILSKPTGGVFLVVPLLAALCLVPRRERSRYLIRCSPGVLGGAALLGFLLARGYGTPLVAGQAAFDGGGALARVVENLMLARDWFTILFTPTMAVALTMAAVLAVGLWRRRIRQDAFLFGLLALAVVPYVVASKVWFPRYVLFAVVPVVLLVGRAVTGLAELLAVPIARRSEARGNVAAVMLTTALTIGLVIRLAPAASQIGGDPVHAAMPETDRRHFITGCSAGYGLPELSAFLREQGRHGPMNLVGFAEQGPVNEGIDVYLTADHNLHRHLVERDVRVGAEQIRSLARKRRTVLVLNSQEDSVQSNAPSAYLSNTERIWTYVRPGDQSRLEVWEVRPDSSPSG